MTKSLQNHFQKLVDNLASKNTLEPRLITQFSQRISEGNWTKECNQENHLCSFFIPVNKRSASLFMGHHIKADQWIPPGGHLDKDEIPVETVRREFTEELRFNLTDEKILLFDIGITKIENPKYPCRLHYDFWHIVFVPYTDFEYDKKEFYDAGWFSFSDALNKTKRNDYKNIIHKVKQLVG